MRIWVSSLMMVVLLSVSAAFGAVVKRPAIVPRYSGAEIGQWTMDHETALAKAREGTNNVVVFFTGAWWCPHCQALESTVLTQPAWQEYVTSNRLYLVMMDFPGRTDQYWCWLRETNYLDSVGLTLAQGEAEITNRYAIQTSYATPDAPVNAFGNYSRVGYPTLIVLRPDGSRMGRFSPLVTTVSMDMVLRNMNQILAGDAGDEADNYYQGATLLAPPECDEEVVSGGTNTLGEADAADWYAFEAIGGLEWNVALSGAGLGDPSVLSAQIYGYPTNATTLAAVGSVTSFPTVVSFVVPQTGLYWLKVARTQSVSNLVSYGLSYWYEGSPATVAFASPQVVVAETEPSVTLTVNISGASDDAEVHVAYETVAETALPDQDYVPTTGELVWGAGPKAPKTITVSLLNHNIAAWEESRSFGVRLSSVRNCSVGTELSVCKVVITDASVRRAGKLGFEGELSALLTEGRTALFSVARTAGADGTVTARIDHVQGTLREAVAQLVWTNGDVAAQSFEFGFPLETGFQYDRASSLQIVPLGGAALASSAQGVLSLVRRDNLVRMSLADYAAWPQNAGFGFKAAQGLWFYGYWSELKRAPDGWVRCGTLEAGQSATLNASLTGPGVLGFDWGVSGDGGTATCSIGSVLKETLADWGVSNSVTVAIPAGRQTLAWTVRRAEAKFALNEVFGGVRNLIWTPLPQSAGLLPRDQAAVINRGLKLSWQDVLGGVTFPAGSAGHYELYAGLSRTALAPYAELTDVAYPREGVPADQLAFANLIAQAATKPIYWRVDTVVTDAAGRRSVYAGQMQSVNILPEGSPEFVASEGGYDPGAEGSATLPAMTVGVRCEQGPFAVASEAGDSLQASVRNGSLPSGMKAELRGGAFWLVGVPTKVGAGTADLHVTATRRVGASVATVPGSSVTVAWTVVPLGRAAGSFDGYRVREDEPDLGNASLSVSARGAISGKIFSGGQTYTFSASSFGGATNGVFFAQTSARAGVNHLPVTVLVDDEGLSAEIRVEGEADSYYYLYRNNWSDTSMAALLANEYVGYYTVALPVLEQGAANAPAGAGYLTLTVKPNGTVTYSGQLADGKNVSGTATLLYGPDCCSELDRVTFYVLSRPVGYRAAEGVYGLFHLAPGESRGPQDNTLLPGSGLGVHWVNTDPKSVFGYNPVTGEFPNGVSGFSNVVDVTGGFYDKTVNLQTFYAGRTLVIGTPFEATRDLGGAQGTTGFTLLSAPDLARLPAAATAATTIAFPPTVLVKNGTLVDVDASTNPWGMKLTPNVKSGIFTGGCKYYYQGLDGAGRVTQRTLSVVPKGVFLPVRSASQDYGDWLGFYLVQDVYRYDNGRGGESRYPFNWSFGFSLLLQELQ